MKLEYLICLICSLALVSCNKPIDNVLERNRKLRGTLDETTIFDSAYIDNNNFIYSYTIKNHKSQSPTEIGIEDRIFEKIIQEKLIPSVNLENEEFKIIYDANLNIVFRYFSADFNENIANVIFKRGSNNYRFERPDNEWNELVDDFYEKAKLNSGL